MTREDEVWAKRLAHEAALYESAKDKEGVQDESQGSVLEGTVWDDYSRPVDGGRVPGVLPVRGTRIEWVDELPDQGRNTPVYHTPGIASADAIGVVDPARQIHELSDLLAPGHETAKKILPKRYCPDDPAPDHIIVKSD